VREQLIELIMSCGHDMLRSCELADGCIKDFQESGDSEATYYIKDSLTTMRAFVIQRKAVAQTPLG
jgi:hypothetical protein